MFKTDVIVGGFFGDEGKGKYVGGVGHDYDAVLRVNASTNAGHCVSDGETTHITRQLPSVFFPRQTLLVIAPGALLNPTALAQEVEGRPDIEQLRGKLKVASSVSLVIRPYIEKGQGFMSNHIGSTHQGTGPSAVARAARHSLHLYDLAAVADGGEAERATVRHKLRRTCLETLPLRFAADPESQEHQRYFDEVLSELVAAYERTRELVGEFCVDYSRFVIELQQRPGQVLIEGCNGMLLDNLHGALPHVTSASTNVGAMICGANLSPHSVRRVIVVISCYSTCLGKRPFPTEVTAEEDDHFFENCNEIDPAEHNRRRIGWIDLPGLRKALAGANGAVLHMNKLDVLSGLERIKLCTHYRIAGQRHDVLPDDPRLYARAEPCYKVMDGWQRPLCELRQFSQLPRAAQRYVRMIDEALPNRIASLGVGPRNEDVIQVAP